MTDRTCVGCAAPIDPSEHGNRKWCSMRCRWKFTERAKAARSLVRDRTCITCGGPFTVPETRGMGAAPKRCPECIAAGRLPVYSYDYYVPVTDTPRPCLWCSEPFMAKGSAGYCSTLCRNRSNRAKRKQRDPKRYAQQRRERADRHRARKAGATVETFSHHDVFDRDGWICGLCDEPIPREAKHPDPLSVSLDHIVPLSLGGEHSMANTQASHFLCNVTKGANVDVTAGRSR